MTVSERMVAGAFGGMMLIVGGRVLWLVGAEPVGMALGGLLFLGLGLLCALGAICGGE